MSKNIERKNKKHVDAHINETNCYHNPFHIHLGIYLSTFFSCFSYSSSTPTACRADVMYITVLDFGRVLCLYITHKFDCTKLSVNMSASGPYSFKALEPQRKFTLNQTFLNNSIVEFDFNVEMVYKFVVFFFLRQLMFDTSVAYDISTISHTL